MTWMLQALALVAAGEGAGKASAEPALQPIRPWVVDFGETMCSASVTYGSAEDPTTIAFRPAPGEAMVRVIVIKSGRVSGASYFSVRTNVSSPGEREPGLSFPGKNRNKVLWVHLDAAEMARLADAGEIAFLSSRAIKGRFALPKFAAVQKKLAECSAGLRAHWNMVDAPDIAQPPEPLAPLQSYFSSADYPDQAVMGGADGTSEMLLMIDETGKLRDCMTQKTSGFAILDAQSCAVLMERARFKPARDAEGKPVRSASPMRIRWVV